MTQGQVPSRWNSKATRRVPQNIQDEIVAERRAEKLAGAR